MIEDAAGAGEQLARSKACARWLRDEIVARGMAADELDADEGGWMIAIPSGDGTVLVILSGGEKDDSFFNVIVTPIGATSDAAAHVDAVISDVLTAALFVSELSIEM